MWFGPPILSRFQDLGYKTQDSTMQDIGDRIKCRIQEYIRPLQPHGPLRRGRPMTGSTAKRWTFLLNAKAYIPGEESEEGNGTKLFLVRGRQIAPKPCAYTQIKLF